MAFSDIDLSLIIDAKNNAKAVIDGLRKDVNEVSKAASGVGSHFSGAFDVLKKGALVATAGITTLASGITTLAAGIGYSVKNFAESENAQAQLNAVLKSTGGVAGITADEVNKLSTQLERQSGVSDEAVTAAQSMLLTFTSVGKDVFPDATKTALDMATALNHGLIPSTEQLSGSTVLLGKALQDPDAGLGALKRVGVNVDELSKKFNDSMSIQEKQKLILQELQTEYGGSAEAAGQTLTGALNILKESFGDITEQVGAEFAPVITAVAKQLGDFAIWINDNFGTLKEQVLAFFASFGDGQDIFESFREKGQEIVESLKGLFGELGEAFNSNKQLMVDLAVNGFGFLMESIKVVIDIVTAAISFYNDHKDTINQLIVVVGLAIAAYKAWQIAMDIKNTVMALTGVITPQTVALAALALAVIAVQDAYNALQKDLDKLNDTYETGADQVALLDEKIKNTANEEDRKKFEKMRDEIQAQNDTVKATEERYRGWQGAITAVGETLNDMLGTVGDALGKFVEWIVNGVNSAFSAVGNFLGSITEGGVNALNGMFSAIGDALSGFIEGAVTWGQHMVDNFAQGIRNAVGGLKDSLGNVGATIKEAIGFSKNPNIPSEVWGAHMMDNFASGIDYGNEAVVDSLKDTIKAVEDSIKEFSSSFDDLSDRTQTSLDKFNDATKTAKKNFRDAAKSIRDDVKDLRKSFREDFANSVLDIRNKITDLKAAMSDNTGTFNSTGAGIIVTAQDALAKAQADLATETAKSPEQQNAADIQSLQNTIQEKQAFLNKHADFINSIEGDIEEERRVRSLDEIDLLQENYNKQQEELQKNVDAQQAILDAHKTQIDKYNADITEAARVAGLDQLALLTENKNKELDLLNQRLADEKTIRNDALKDARKEFKQSYKQIKQETNDLIDSLAAKFSTIPTSINDAFTVLGQTLQSAGTALASTSKTVNNTNNKTIILNMNDVMGETKDEKMARLKTVVKSL